ncbi:hypothetical protein LTR37_014118 [Vermiconidia calcicola]|uniref:Uncharacterized protein n=1 Tax=Vermiconidia calcicola TaxID=1690605 RepID=A0ACC3MW38_9PEZI|nr:hypothetical protein LTR37_014118 [Vermiconidia calcicola]
MAASSSLAALSFLAQELGGIVRPLRRLGHIESKSFVQNLRSRICLESRITEEENGDQGVPNMDVTVQPVPRSLDRLKALDSLPDPASQLEEAKQLCTHAARADMIAKWLLERFKASKEARGSTEAWKTLHLAFRLLSPERLATLIATHDFLGTIKAGLERADEADVPLPEIAIVLAFLLEVSNGSDAAHVKAVLSVPAPFAAAFLGLWFRCSRKSVTTQDDSSQPTLYPLLVPGVEIWRLRKHSGKENELFAEHCLVSASSLLTENDATRDQSPSRRKRKLGHEAEGQGCKKVIESLLARHVFLPTRSAFFKTQSQSESSNLRHVGSQKPSYMIEHMLEPLQTFFAEPRQDEQHISAILSKLLDVALRCAPQSTPRQLMKERPWIEALFEALNSCNKDSDGALIHRAGLVGMLSVIGQHATLSKETLTSIIKTHSKIDSSDRGSIDWLLIAQVVELDSDVCTDHQLAEVLFSSLTPTMVQCGDDLARRDVHTRESDLISDPGYDWHPDATGGPLQLRWKDGIVVPVMKAFAKRRDLETFIGLWKKQLLNDTHNEIWSVWTKLNKSFEPLVEESLTGSQIIQLFDSLYSDFADASPLSQTEKIPLGQGRLHAGVVILSAVLNGIRSDALLDDLHGRLGALFDELRRLYDQFHDGVELTGPMADKERCAWSLTTKVFEMWFPLWAAQQSDPSIISEKGVSLLESDSVRTALEISRSTRTVPEALVRSKRLASDVDCYIGSLCSYFYPYEQGQHGKCAAICAETANKLLYSMDPSNIEVLLRYPRILAIVDGDTRRDVLSSCIGAVATSTGSISKDSSALVALQAVAISAVRESQTEVIADLVQVALSRLERNGGSDRNKNVHKGDNTLSIEEQALFDSTSAIPTQSLSRAQREAIIKTTCRLQCGLGDEQKPEAQRGRLALLVKMMELPNATSTLSTDPAELWSLARSTIADDAAEELKNITLFEALVKSVLGHLLSTQDQDRSRAMLIKLSEDVRDQIDLICTQHQLDGCSWTLAMIKSVVGQLETEAREDLKSQLAHRNTAAMKGLAALCFELVTGRMVGDYMDLLAVARTKWLQPALHTLLQLPEVLVQHSSAETDASLENTIELFLHRLEAFVSLERPMRDEEGTQEEQTYLTPAIVSCYELGCKYDKSRDAPRLARIAARILEFAPQPTECAATLTAFGRYLNKPDIQARLQLVGFFLSRTTSFQTSVMSLLEIWIANLDKTAMECRTESWPGALISMLLLIVMDNQNLMVTKKAIDCILLVLRQKSFLINQHGIEATLAACSSLSKSDCANTLYVGICSVVSVLLLQYRSQLQGRFHLVIKVFQALMSCLFQKSKAPASIELKTRPPTAKAAQELARLLVLFCEPPQPRRQSNGNALVDESRKQQARVGQYAQYVLHHYCTQVLVGTTVDGIREALTPGVWSAIEAIEINDAEGIKSLSAAMNNSERAVLRDVYGDWRRFGKWRGG